MSLKMIFHQSNLFLSSTTARYRLAFTYHRCFFSVCNQRHLFVIFVALSSHKCYTLTLLSVWFKVQFFLLFCVACCYKMNEWQKKFHNKQYGPQKYQVLKNINSNNLHSDMYNGNSDSNNNQNNTHSNCNNSGSNNQRNNNNNHSGNFNNNDWRRGNNFNKNTNTDRNAGENVLTVRIVERGQSMNNPLSITTPKKLCVECRVRLALNGTYTQVNLNVYSRYIDTQSQQFDTLVKNMKIIDSDLKEFEHEYKDNDVPAWKLMSNNDCIVVFI